MVTGVGNPHTSLSSSPRSAVVDASAPVTTTLVAAALVAAAPLDPPLAH